MTELLLHSTTAAMIQDVVRAKHHGVLLVGAPGSGKTTIAKHLASQLLATESLENYPYYLELSDETLGIDQVRSIREFLKRKTTGDGEVRRICLLDHVDTMTSEAANALLKTLEEPAPDTVLILTAESLAGVPRTIQSRVQALQIAPVSQNQAAEYFSAAGYSMSDISKAYSVSEGRVALMSVLLSEPNHPLVESIRLAKQLLGGASYERLLEVDALSKDREAIERLLFGLERIATSLVHASASKANAASIKRAHRTLSAVEAAQTALRHRANTKLLLTDLFVNM